MGTHLNAIRKGHLHARMGPVLVEGVQLSSWQRGVGMAPENSGFMGGYSHFLTQPAKDLVFGGNESPVLLEDKEEAGKGKGRRSQQDWCGIGLGCHTKVTQSRFLPKVALLLPRPKPCRQLTLAPHPASQESWDRPHIVPLLGISETTASHSAESRGLTH